MIYGLMAEFDNPSALVAAAREAHAAGYRRMDAYTPFPVEELNEALGLGHTGVAAMVLIGGITGALVGYLMQYYIAVIDYPLNIGGRPLHSWPAFIPVTFELTILMRGAIRRPGHAGLKRTAHAASPGIQRATLRTGQPRPILSLHRSGGPYNSCVTTHGAF